MKIKVLVVDDSAFMRKVIADMLRKSNQIEVVGFAQNGREAIQKIEELKPNVVTLDVEMPVLNGLEALKIIMKQTPLPVVMLSSVTKNGATQTILAMEYGAVDFITKPEGLFSTNMVMIEKDLIQKVLVASQTKMKFLEPKNLHPLSFPTNSFSPTLSTDTIVAIGTSTGGPRALQEVLTRLPTHFAAPIVIVQHMPAGFTKSLAVRLNQICSITVKEAEHGDVLQKGTAYIAPGGKHMKIIQTLRGKEIQLTEEALRGGFRPSVDVLFESLTAHTRSQIIAVVMTGMGSDGAKGLLQLKEKATCSAIAESEDTSVVYGMPKAAVATGEVNYIVPLHQIAEKIINELYHIKRGNA